MADKVLQQRTYTIVELKIRETWRKSYMISIFIENNMYRNVEIIEKYTATV